MARLRPASMRKAIAITLALTATILAGCGAVARIPASQFNTADFSIGKALFSEKCASCHTLADANAKGTIGPNLDDAFGPDKLQGFHLSTIADVVRGQIAYADTYPGQIADAGAVPGVDSQGMPANLLRGQQARDVAVYVAQCSSNPKCGITAATLPSS